MKPLRLLDLSVEPINQLKPTRQKMELIWSKALIRGFQFKFNILAKLINRCITAIRPNLVKMMNWVVVHEPENQLKVESIVSELNELSLQLFCFEPYKLSHEGEKEGLFLVKISQRIGGEVFPFFMQPSEYYCSEVISTLELLGEKQDLMIVEIIDNAYDCMTDWQDIYFELMKLFFKTAIDSNTISYKNFKSRDTDEKLKQMYNEILYQVCNEEEFEENNNFLIKLVSSISVNDTNGFIDRMIFQTFLEKLPIVSILNNAASNLWEKEYAESQNFLHLYNDPIFFQIKKYYEISTQLFDIEITTQLFDIEQQYNKKILQLLNNNGTQKASSSSNINRHINK